ncbi:cytochrome b5-related protein-like [Topomyia yanbarensis]|uniref:cytochrome b5-related protein-like n=1 Tax=Topomyia yanbarensis TaxID=2498891 RepID=UPI00273AC9A3|nr:cytochrome b5-related protein-like [Topomyia yanbarensis]XP_058815406.1 cytochrome b5-related protein-like [Topomyia yanbarensis]XP_058815407.1 cytochrome b5-related protein-like [Topomyia yanbarensis]XP_058815408.1 cytochrome b5-related protein-like [Topomyia yanbarensis]
MVVWTSCTTTTNIAVTDPPSTEISKSNTTTAITTTTTTIASKYPTFRSRSLKTVYSWLAGKRQDDGAEGLWRVHDTLYDLTEFIDRHPGGADWIKLTKGTDITEAFESQHIRNHAEILLPLYKVRVARDPRNVQLTFHEHGFYKTLKRRVREISKNLDTRPARYSELIQDSLLIAFFALVFAAVTLGSYLVAALCGWVLAGTMICAHNFFHQKNNWRMRIFNLAFFSYREQRISHVLSHHFYPNSILDLEISFFEPFLCWLPRSSTKKNRIQRFGSWIYEPLVFAIMFLNEFIKRLVETLFTSTNAFYWDDLITLILPTFMYATSSNCLSSVLAMWIFIVLVGSFAFGFISLNAAHHHPDIVHSGDSIPMNIDFGIYQIATVIDRSDIRDSQLNVLTTFGHHCLHHLFPTMDHGLLPQLNSVFLETCAEFHLEYREYSWWQMFIGQHQQLARVTPMTYVGSKERDKNQATHDGCKA